MTESPFENARKMAGALKPAGEPDFGHRHGRLPQEHPGAIEPHVTVMAVKRLSHMPGEKPLELAHGNARSG
jgi:hypothetical protein